MRSESKLHESHAFSTINVAGCEIRPLFSEKPVGFGLHRDCAGQILSQTLESKGGLDRLNNFTQKRALLAVQWFETLPERGVPLGFKIVNDMDVDQGA